MSNKALPFIAVACGVGVLALFALMRGEPTAYAQPQAQALCTGCCAPKPGSIRSYHAIMPGDATLIQLTPAVEGVHGMIITDITFNPAVDVVVGDGPDRVQIFGHFQSNGNGVQLRSGIHVSAGLPLYVRGSGAVTVSGYVY